MHRELPGGAVLDLSGAAVALRNRNCKG
jgi:hypothetical protein